MPAASMAVCASPITASETDATAAPAPYELAFPGVLAHRALTGAVVAHYDCQFHVPPPLVIRDPDKVNLTPVIAASWLSGVLTDPVMVVWLIGI